jgi:acyl carrier protein
VANFPDKTEGGDMTRPELLKLLQEICEGILEKNCSHVNEQDELTKFGLDSMGCLELVETFELRLEILIPDAFLSGMLSVGQLLDVVEKCDRDRNHWAPTRLVATP